MAKVTQEGFSLLDRIVEFIIPSDIVNFLNQTLYRSMFIIFNYWTFVHFIAGVIFYFLKPKKIKIIIWFYYWIIINIVFEITEYLLGLGGNPLFVEEVLDIIWDILWSLISFVILLFIFRKRKKMKK